MKKTTRSLVVVLAAFLLLTGCKKESSEKAILNFKFASPAVEADITESAKTIVAMVPVGTDVTALVPIITISEKATINPGSGVPQNFTNPVAYTVVAEDGSQAVYTATVIFGNGGGGGGGTSDPTTWSGDIDANTTWPDLGLPVDYIIDGWVEIRSNALLTIEPGVTIMFTGVDGGIGVGENAGLKMVGTAEKPIILEGPANNPNNGSWNGVRISSQRNDNQFEYVQFLRGGSDNDIWTGVVHLTNGRLGMKNCLIDGSLGNGIGVEYEEAFFTAFENNMVKNCAAYPWHNEYLNSACNNIGAGNTFSDNGTNMVNVYYGIGIDENLTMHELSIPYYFRDGMGFYFDQTITIEAGVDIVLPIHAGIGVGDECCFKAEGTASKPIIFRCEDASEPWYGIDFSSSRNGNVMNYCQIKNCGVDEGWNERTCLYIRESAKLTLTNNVFGPSYYNGVGIEYIEKFVNISQSGNTFTNCFGGNVWIEVGGIYNSVAYQNGQILNELP